jgi:S1-C subfamily serine protease
LEDVEGIYVAGVVENGGAYEAGIHEGDVLLSVNNIPINTVSELMGTIGQHNPGEVVKVDVNRDNKLLTYNVTLKNEEGTVAVIKAGETFYNETLGASLKKISHEEKSKLGIDHGLKVTNVQGGILSRGGISEGFIITNINGDDITSEKSLEEALNNKNSGIIKLNGLYLNGVRISYEFMR